MRVAGLILAGGRSSRFGSEKAMADFHGRPMIAWSAEALLTGCNAVAVSAREGSGSACWAGVKGYPLLPDPPGMPNGPLTGVLEGLRWASSTESDVLITAPCDTPRLPPNFACRMTQAIGVESLCAYATSSEGSHPLCAAWRIDCLSALETVLAQGHPSVRQLLDSWGAAQALFPDARAFANINTPCDLGGDASTVPQSGS